MVEAPGLLDREEHRAEHPASAHTHRERTAALVRSHAFGRTNSRLSRSHRPAVGLRPTAPTDRDSQTSVSRSS